ncbi:hypothetical protein [Lacrimispora sp. 38-1]|uniref:hypothetical protein n=1 Tax=Lacrimispora sp. 38-1 TaxID=3125778 RepID=UPI003CE7C718
MIGRILSSLVWIFGMILKGTLKVILVIFQFTIEMLKIALLLFGLIMRIFLAFVRAGTP